MADRSILQKRSNQIIMIDPQEEVETIKAIAIQVAIKIINRGIAAAVVVILEKGLVINPNNSNNMVEDLVIDTQSTDESTKDYKEF
jgi:hypothetical protein